MPDDRTLTTMNHLLERARSWRRIIDAAHAPAAAWGRDTIGAMVNQLLDQPWADLQREVDGAVATAITVDRADTLRVRLIGPGPTEARLNEVKDFAKRLLGDDRIGCPPDLAYLLYYTSLAAARLV